ATPATPTVAAGPQAPPRRTLRGAAERGGPDLPSAPRWHRRLAAAVLRLAPGVLVAALGVLAAIALNRLVPPIGVLTGAVVMGAIVANARLLRPSWAPG